MQKFFSLAARAIVTGLLLYFAFRLVDIEAMRDRLRNTDLNWLALGGLALLIQAFLGAIRWEQIVVRCGSRLTLACVAFLIRAPPWLTKIHLAAKNVNAYRSCDSCVNHLPLK